jgi:hypothetical protein
MAVEEECWTSDMELTCLGRPLNWDSFERELDEIERRMSLASLDVLRCTIRELDVVREEFSKRDTVEMSLLDRLDAILLSLRERVDDIRRFVMDCEDPGEKEESSDNG